ncbi:MAG: hypothetical protein R2710_11090 [Acidimicrobiales bacterium]
MDDQVVVVGSVSKLGWGGLRIGWLRAEPGLVDRLVRSPTDDLVSSIPSQVISAAVLAQFDDDRGESTAITRAPGRPGVSPAHRAVPRVAVAHPHRRLVAVDHARSTLRGTSCAASGTGRAIIDRRSATPTPVTGDEDRHIRLRFDRPEQQLVEGVDRLVRAWHRLGD